MWNNLRSVGLVALSALLAVEAGQFSDKVFQRSQRANTLFKQLDSQATNSSSSSQFRFLNKNTTKYQVKSLPDVHYDIGEMYSGNIPISNNDTNRTLFFVFQPTVGQPVDEVTIWLNGGPGCSSLDGFIQENGRFLWQPGTFIPTINPYSWVNLTNMLWVEQPVGTGFTTGIPKATSEEDIAREFADFFKNFQDIFGIKKFKIYVTGESYAGRYVPYISAEMLNRKNKDYFALTGALVYDGVIGQFTYEYQANLVPLVLANQNLFTFNQSYLKQITALHESCGYKAYLDKYLQFPPPGKQPAIPADVPAIGGPCDLFDSVNNAALAVNPCFDIYEINQQCPLLWTVIGFPTELVYNYPGAQNYFNRTDVKTAMHAPQNIEWTECKPGVFVGNGGPEGEGDLSADPIQKVLPQVIEATNRVLVANGDFDMIVITNGSLASIQNMTWGGKLGFQQRPSTLINLELTDLQYQQVFIDNGLAGVDGPQGVVGIQHYERGLMWAETFASGHMQPEFQARASYRHLQWVLGRVKTL